MRTGRFPGQQEAVERRLEAIRAEERQRSSRRAFCALLAGGLTGATAATVVRFTPQERTTAGATLPTRDPSVDQLAMWAQAPTEELLRRQAVFMQEVGLHPEPLGDDRVWVGVTRLASLCVDRDDRLHSGIRPGLMLLRRRSDLPSHVVLWLQLVQKYSR